MEKKSNKGRMVSAPLPVSMITLGINVLSLTGYLAAASRSLSIVCRDYTSTSNPRSPLLISAVFPRLTWPIRSAHGGKPTPNSATPHGESVKCHVNPKFSTQG